MTFELLDTDSKNAQRERNCDDNYALITIPPIQFV